MTKDQNEEYNTIMSEDENITPEKSTRRESAGKTTISPDVLLTIARLTTLEIPGVSRMSTVPAGVNRLFTRKYGEGVRIDITNDTVSVDLYIILENDVNIRDVSRKIQHEVARAISDMVGMTIGRINIHIDDIDYPTVAN